MRFFAKTPAAIRGVLAATAGAAALLVAAPALADAGSPSSAAPGTGVCREAPAALPTMEALARLQARLQAEAAAAGEDAPIVLNGRGYNYASHRDPVRELQILQAERDRARAR